MRLTDMQTAPFSSPTPAAIELAPGQARWLERLRLGAAATVAAAHAIQICLYPLLGHAHPIARASGFAASIAVGLFFFISGYLIACSITSRTADDYFHWRGFLAARIRRIMPPFLLAVVLTVVIVGIIRFFNLYGAEAYLLPGDLEAFRSRATTSLAEIIWTLTLSYNLIPGYGTMLSFNGPLWSLSFEIWLYAAAGFWAAGHKNHKPLVWLVAAAIVGIPAVLNNRLFIIFALIWISGFILGQIRVNRIAIPLYRAAWIWICVMIAAASVSSEIRLLLYGPYGANRANAIFIANILAISYVLFSPIWWPHQAGARALSASTIPDFSYTLYITHFPLLGLGYSVLRPQLDPGSIVHMAMLAVVLFTGVLTLSAILGPRLESLFRAPRRLTGTTPPPSAVTRPAPAHQDCGD